MSDELAGFLEEHAAEAEQQPPCMALLINEPGLSVDLILDTKRSYYGDWIEGEGGDICLYRDMETGKVVGCHLPLMQREFKWSRLPIGDDLSEAQPRVSDLAMSICRREGFCHRCDYPLVGGTCDNGCEQ